MSQKLVTMSAKELDRVGHDAGADRDLNAC